jgi:hypothetical protein
MCSCSRRPLAGKIDDRVKQMLVPGESGLIQFLLLIHCVRDQESFRGGQRTATARLW